MNFLAHLWLTDRAGLPLAGALLGDYFRGALPADLPPDLAQSVRLHRRIDATTDRHPMVAAARARFAAGARRYSGILLDVLYDHILAQEWPQYSGEPLPDFALRAAHDIGAQATWFERAGGPVPEAASFNLLLLSYASEAGIEHALRRTARRLKKPQGMLDALPGWQAHLPGVRADLPVLLADLRALSENFGKL